MLLDLHSHSTVSDGLYRPSELAALMAQAGVGCWALTDHDTVDGIAEARAAAHKLGLRFVAGVEISVTYMGKTVHIVGLGVDENQADLQAHLLATRSGRDGRMQAMADRLGDMGIAGAYEGALALAGNPELLSRTHLARFLVQAGHVPSVQAAFDRYLADGQPACVPMQWAKLGDAVAWIRAAGGVAVMAHPGRYDFSPLQEEALFADFIAAGGQAVEVMTGSHREHELPHYAALAQRLGLAHSCGSDFHGIKEGEAPGRYPQMDLAGLPCVTGLLVA